jgi:hypothetical protein
MSNSNNISSRAREVGNEVSNAADNVINQARPYVNNPENLLHRVSYYAHPACTYLAAVGFFMSGQARLAPLFTGKKQGTQQDNSDDGLIPMLSRLGVRFSSSNAATIIGLIKMALTIGLIYVPTRRTAARWGIAYTALGLIARLNQGITLSPPLINMALLSLPAQIFSSI